MNLLNDGDNNRLASAPSPSPSPSLSPSPSSPSFLSSSLSSNSSYSITLREKLKQRANHFREMLRELRKEDLISYLLFFVMGTSSWMLVNGVYLQIPFFIAYLPEKESIGAWISIVIQLSNSVALFLLLFNYFFRPLPYVPTIGLNILLGVLTSLLLSFFWDVKTKINDEEHSVVLLILTFLAAVVGSVAVTFYYPFTSLYHSSMISAVATGMGMTGLVASAISWVQQKGNGEVRFGVETYYQVTTFFLVTALAALGGLVWWEKKGYLTKEQTPASSASSLSTSTSRFSPLPDNDEERIRESEREVRIEIPEREGEREMLRGGCSTRKEILKEVLKEGWFAGLNQFLICVMNYIILGILPYSASGYQDPIFKFELIFHLNVYSLSIGAITRYLSTHLRLYCIPLQTLIQILLFVGVLIACLRGPSTPLDQSDTWLLVFMNTLYSGLYGYEDTMLYHYAKQYSRPRYVEHVTRFVAICNQLGAFVGASISIALVFAGVFNQ